MPTRDSKANAIRFKTGDRVGRWTLVEPATRSTSGHKRWLCRCDCGTEKVLFEGNLRPRVKRGLMSLSCGCWRDERVSESSTIHGHCKPGDRSPEYISWMGMLMRCTNPNDAGYPEYGGSGITVCDRWRESFENFLGDMGPKPTPEHQIDRYPDNHGNYEPSNCRWASRSENQNNRDCNVRLEHDGKTMTVAEWSAVTGIKWSTIRERLKRGWSASRTLTTPVDSRCHRKATDGRD